MQIRPISALMYSDEDSSIVIEGKYKIPKMVTQMSDQSVSSKDYSLGHLLDKESNCASAREINNLKSPAVRTSTKNKLADQCRLL